MEMWIGIIASAIGGLILILLGVIAFFGKKWMNAREQNEKDRTDNDALEKEKRDKKEADIRAELVTTTAKIASDLSRKHAETVKELTEQIAGNRQVYIQHYEGTSAQIKEMDDRLVKRMDIANGRTTKVEKAVKNIIKNCDKRSQIFYKEAEGLRLRGSKERRGDIKPKIKRGK
jgi:hypothetical protein